MDLFNMVDYFHANFPHLRECLLRVRVHWVKKIYILRQEAVDIFTQMIDCMPYHEVPNNFEESQRLWGYILEHHYRGVDFHLTAKELNPAFKRFVSAVNVVCLDKSSKLENFVRVSATALDVDEGTVLRIYEYEHAPLRKYYGKSLIPHKQFSKNYKVCESNLLMKDYKMLKPLAEILIKRGCKYSLDVQYIQSICFSFYCPRFLIKGVHVSFQSGISKNGDLRHQLALELLQAIFIDLGLDASAGQYHLKEITRLMWRAMPFPYISQDEMYALLLPYYTGPLSLEEVCAEYTAANDIFEVPPKKEPRTLKHLVRVQVRRQLAETKVITDERIDELFLPKFVKDYLKLEYY